MAAKSSNKKKYIPVLKDRALFDMLSNTGLTRYLGAFGAPGSVPPTVSYSMVNRYPDHYEIMEKLEFTATLKLIKLIEPRYASAGMIMENTESGARYFMLEEEYINMANQVISDRNQFTGQWQIFKEGHAFSLRWLPLQSESDSQ
jgi:hypothetical protein